MDERMMNLFSLIAEQIRDKQELFDDEGKIMQTLVDSGYHFHEADAALTIMQSLARKKPEPIFMSDRPRRTYGVRAMSRQERTRLTVEAFGFVSRLASLGIITEDQREDILEKAMTVYPDRIEINQIKTLAAPVLFNARYEQDDERLFPAGRAENTAWN